MPKPLPQGLEIRQVRPADISSLAELLVSAPDDGTLYQFPHVLEHPDEMHELHVGWLRPSIHSPTTLIRVAVLPKGEKQVVVGFSSWTKNEADPKAEGNTRAANMGHTTWTDSLNTWMLDLESKYRSLVGKKSGPSKALEPDKAHQEAVRRVRKRAPPSPTRSNPSYELNGLAVRSEYQSYGIGSLLVRWGLDKASEDGLPVFATGEAQGVDFYEKAMGFQRLRGTEYWLDRSGQDIGSNDVQAGNEAWKRANGGLSGAEMIWCPKGCEFNIGGHVYKG